MPNLTHSEFTGLAADILDNGLDYIDDDTREYIDAVWHWATDYALPLDDADYIMAAAAAKYAGKFEGNAEFAKSVYEDAYSERVEAIRSLAMQEPMIEVRFDWEATADLVMQNTQGLDFAAFGGHYFWAAD